MSDDELQREYMETRSRVVQGRASQVEADAFIDLLEGAVPNERYAEVTGRAASERERKRTEHE